jgi:hypothetical protein
LFGISRQGVYQRENRKSLRILKLNKVKELVQYERLYLPRLGTRKLYYLLKNQFIAADIKIGRDALFTYLKHQHMLIKPLKSYHKTTQ